MLAVYLSTTTPVSRVTRSGLNYSVTTTAVSIRQGLVQHYNYKPTLTFLLDNRARVKVSSYNTESMLKARENKMIRFYSL